MLNWLLSRIMPPCTPPAAPCETFGTDFRFPYLDRFNEETVRATKIQTKQHIVYDHTLINLKLVGLVHRFVFKMQRDDEEIINQICDYAQEKQIKELLQEYLKRVILTKPEDPLKFLIQTIRENPHVPAGQVISEEVK